MRILPRYLLRELVVPLCVGVTFLFLLLFVMSVLRGTNILLGSAVTAQDLLRFTVYMTPEFLQQALPIAFLLALLLGLGRLSEDGELTALQAMGVSPLQLLRAPAVLAVLLAALMLLLSFTAQPWGLKSIERAVNDVIKRNLAQDVKTGVFYEDLPGLTVYTENVPKGQNLWHHVLVYDDREPATPLLVLAQQGLLDASGEHEALRLLLSDGEMHRTVASSGEHTVLQFEQGAITVGIGDANTSKNPYRRPSEIFTPAELLELARDAEARGDDGRTWRMNFHYRLGQVLMPMSFALLGAPLAMRRQRTGRARGFLLTVAGYFAYYVLARACVGLGENGYLPLLLAGQLPNLVFSAVGAWGLYRLTREGTGR